MGLSVQSQCANNCLIEGRKLNKNEGIEGARNKFKKIQK
jgi:hypothetical protein